jgi:probable phosphoglycerate mutase
MKLALLRHGVTDWNLEKRVQGRIDKPLSELGRQQLQRLSVPPEICAYRWFCSPLRRAMQTAELLNLNTVEIEAALIEMSWGDWEGEIQVQARLQTWLQKIASSEQDTAALVHKGIIRCIYALAFDWDMRGESPVDFAWDALHLFELSADGKLLDSYQSIPLLKT